MFLPSFYEIRKLHEKIKNMKDYINDEMIILDDQRDECINKYYNNNRKLINNNPTIFIENDKIIDNIKTLSTTLFNEDKLLNNILDDLSFSNEDKDIKEFVFLNFYIKIAKKIIVEFKALRKNQTSINKFFQENIKQ
jgi:hypothetical protein